MRKSAPVMLPAQLETDPDLLAARIADTLLHGVG